MARLRQLASLLLVTAFAAFQLLATAPQLHAHCSVVEALGQGFQGPSIPAVHPRDGADARGTTECPVCMVSSLSAILSPGPSVFAPAVRLAGPPLPAGVAVRGPFSKDLRSRAPPAA
jgi:hypothetical protein